jgi:hypothetical protein
MITTFELRTLLATMLAGAADGGEDHWRLLIGDIAVLPLAMNPHSNWAVQVRGNAKERAAIEEAVRLVREEHPFVGGRSPKAGVVRGH